MESNTNIDDGLFDHCLADTDLFDTMSKDCPIQDVYSTSNPFGEASLLCSIFMVTVAAIGLLTNAITLRIFTHRLLVSSINTFLAGLALIDAALLLTAVPLYSSVALYSYLTRDTHDPSATATLETAIAYMTVYLYPFTAIFQTASVWTMVVITVERYIAVCHPFVARKACTWRRAAVALVAVGVLSVLYNISRFWEYDIHIKNETDTGSELKNETDVVSMEDELEVLSNNGPTVEVVSALRSNRDYMNIYVHWLYFIFLFAVPFVVLVLLNTMVVVTIRRANRFRATLSRRQCKEHATATMMVVVAVIFLACNSLGCILNAMDVFGFSTEELTYPVESELELTKFQPYHRNGSDKEDALSVTIDTAELPSHTPFFYFLIDLSNLLVMAHCTCNFFIYLIFSNRFRTHFCILSNCSYNSERRLSDLKSPHSMDRDPLSAVSRYQRRSCVTDNGNRVVIDFELVPSRAGSSKMSRASSVRISPNGARTCVDSGLEERRRQYSRLSKDSSETLLHRPDQANSARGPSHNLYSHFPSHA